MMFREKVTEALPGMGQEFRVPPMKVLEMRQEIGQARAIRLDEKARKLVDHYMDGLSQTAVEDILVSMQLPWPRMWMEFPAEDGRDSGILFIQDAKKLTCEFYEESIGDPLYAIYPPVVRIVMDRVAETYRVEATEVCRTMMVVMGADPESREELNALLEENRLQGITHVARAAVLSVLLQAREILEVEEGATVPRAVRRRAERAGDKLPPTPVSRINLGAIGRTEYAMCLEEGPRDSDMSGEAYEARRRRAHWVRGHMFIARNRQLTYRRPHIRGAGAVLDNVMAITAPEEDDLQP